MQGQFTVNVGRNFGTKAGVHLIEDVCKMWSLLNTGFTVFLIN